jgi:hypothetical protein
VTPGAGPPAHPAGLADPRHCARLLARAVDRAFVSAMSAPRAGGGRELVARYGGTAAVGALVEFRTALGWPGRTVTPAQLAAVLRYRDPAEYAALLRGHAEHGTLDLDRDGGFRATGRGREFLAELLALQGGVLTEAWVAHADRVGRLNALLGRLLDAAAGTGGDAFAAMAPPYEPPAAAPAAVLLNRLGTLRYHRADAHAAAWGAAGLTAAQVQALAPGPGRDAVEAETDRRAAGPYTSLAVDERLALLADLAALP